MNIKNMLKKAIFKMPVILLLLTDKKILKLDAWISKSHKLYKLLKLIFPFYKLNHYLKSIGYKLEKAVNSNLISKETVQKYCLNKIENSDDATKLYITKILFSSNLLDKGIVRKLFNVFANISNIEVKYWFFIDISIMTFLSIDCLYNEFYNDRRKFLKSLALENNLDINVNYSYKEESICIITYLLSSSIRNSLQRVVMMIQKGISKDIKNISILSLQSFFPKSIGYKYTYFSPKKDEKNKKKIKQLFPNCNVYFSEGKTSKEIMQSALKILEKINPSLIIDVSDEYSITSYIYSQKIPTLYIPMRNYASSSFFNYIVGKRWRFELVNKQFNSIKESQIIDWFFPEYIPPKSRNLKKEELGLASNQKVIVTVGNNNKTCDKKFVDMMAKLLNDTDLVWLLIGSEGPQYLHIKYEHLIKNKKIIEYGYSNNLYGIYAACDILIRPNTTAGSGATAIAAMQGLPIVMTSYICDAMRWLDLDFTSCKTYNDLYNEVLHLCNDNNYYKEKSLLSLERVKKATDAEVQWEKLVKIIRRIEFKYQ